METGVDQVRTQIGKRPVQRLLFVAQHHLKHVTAQWNSQTGSYLVAAVTPPYVLPEDAEFVFAYARYDTPLVLPRSGITLTFSGAPFSTLLIQNSEGTPGRAYFMATTFHQGSYPNGYWFGIDAPLNELFEQWGIAQPPFRGNLDYAGESCWWLPGGFPYLGITMYAVTVEHVGGLITDASPPIAHPL